MGSSLVRGKYVVSRVIDADSSEIIEDGAVFQRDGEIVEVGPYAELKARHSPDEEIGSSDFMVIPGLVNAHHHQGLTPFQRGRLDYPLELTVQWYAIIRAVDPYLDTLYCAMQMIESGTTTVMHNHLRSAGQDVFRALEAYKETGMRVAFSPMYRNQNHNVFDDDEEFRLTLPPDLAKEVSASQATRQTSMEDYLSLCAELFATHQSDRTRIFISPHNVHTCSDESLREIKNFATRHTTGIHIHLLESVYQKMYGARNWGKSPLAHLYDLGFLGPELSCAHGVWLTDSDMDILVETSTIIDHNPSSNMRIKSGIAPVNRMLEKGITLALGIDEAGINDDNDMFQEMRLAQKLHGVPVIGSPSPTSHQILHMATMNGAKAAFFGDQAGTLEPGKRADMVLVSLEHMVEPYLAPETNMVDALLYRGRGLDVDTVMVDGEVLLKNRKFTKLDKAEVAGRLKESLRVPLTPEALERAELGRRLLPYVQHFFEEHRPVEKGAPYYFYNGND